MKPLATPGNFLRLVLQGLRMRRLSLRRQAHGPGAFPLKINFDVTYRCNSRCQTCDIWKRQDDPALEMTPERYRRVFASIGRRPIILSFEGGEPALRGDMGEILRDAVRGCPGLVSLMVATNGLLPDRIQRFVEAALPTRVPIIVSLSVDGFRDLHDEIRGVPGNFRKIEETLERLAILSQRHPNVEAVFQTTVSPLNYTRLEDFLAWRPEIPRVFTLSQNLALFRVEGDEVGHPEHDVRLMPDKGALLGVVKRLQQTLPWYTPMGLLNLLYFRKARRFLEDHRSPVDCTASLTSLYIGPRGEVTGCLAMHRPFAHLADFDDDLVRLYASQERQAMRQEIAAGRCPQCWTLCEALPSLACSSVVQVFRR